jgi:hypothetical protein
MANLWRDFWMRETGTGQQVAQLHDRYMIYGFHGGAGSNNDSLLGFILCTVLCCFETSERSTLHVAVCWQLHVWVAFMAVHHRKCYENAQRIFNLGAVCRWTVGFTPRLIYNRGSSPPYPLDRLAGPQSRSGHGGGQKNIESWWFFQLIA